MSARAGRRQWCQAHRGIAAIRAWRSKVPRVAYTIHEVKATTAGHDAAVDIAGAGESGLGIP